MKSKFTLLVLAACCVFGMNAQVLINENFNNPTALTFTSSGWTIINKSSPLGLTSWFPGNIGVFPAYSSPDSTYMAANYNNTTGNTGTISDWLITPTVTLFNGGVLQFATRTNTAAPQSVAADRLIVYYSVGTGTDVGTSSTTLGTFTNSVPNGTINPNLTATGYPTAWTVYTATLANVTGTVTGRFGFRYFVTSAGPTGTNSSYIGLDNVKYEVPCPNPTLSISTSTAGICSGNTFTVGAAGANTYTWSSGQNTPSVTLSPTATTVYTLTGSSTPACNSSITVPISVTVTPNLSVLSVTTCPGTAATLAASGASTYSWSTGSTSATVVDTPTMNTTYTVTGNNGDCSSTTTVSIALGASLSINVVAQPTLICSGKPTTLTTSGASSYTYASITPSVTFSNHTAVIALSPTVNTTYMISGTSGTCMGTNTILINVIPSPAIIFTASPTNATLCAGTNVTFSLSGAATYTWTNRNSSSSFLTIVTPTTSGLTSFAVVGTGTNGCVTNLNISRTIDLCTGIEKLTENDGSVSVYPNPFSNELQISGMSGNVEVYTALGQLVIRESFSDSTPVNTSELAKGIYILKAFSEDKKLVTTVKLIKN